MNNQENINTVPLSDEYKNMMNKITDFVNMANTGDLLTCGPECQENKAEQSAYDNYVIQKTNLVNAPKQFETAEKEYIVATKGRDYFNKLKIKEYSEDADNLVNKFNNKISNLTKLIESRIANSSTLDQSIENTGELTNDYITKVANLKEKISDAKSDANIAKRKTYYDNQSSGWWCSLNYYLKVVFWIMFVIYMLIAVIYKQYNKQHVRVGAILFPALMYFDVPNLMYDGIKKIFSIL